MSQALQLLAILALAPAVQGIMTSLRARLNGRPGPSPFQPYRDLRKLWSKEALIPTGCSPIVAAAPGILAGAAVTVAALVPSLGAMPRTADAVAIALTLGLGRFVLVLASLDTRSSFQGMAASREMTFASLSEAPLILALVSMALGTDATLAGVLACAALLFVCLSETARLPVDNQETHYELTMIHEGTLLEYSGWHLALLEYASYVRQLALFMLAALLLPGGAVAVILWLGLIALAIPVVERTFAKLRLFEVPPLFAAATILALSSIVVHLVGLGS